MATLKFGVIVTGARGTIAGTIFSANAAGPYARGWSRGKSPQTTGQAATRARLSLAAQQWALLTDGQRTDWDTWAADPAQEKTNSLGEPYYITGFQWFAALTANRARVGLDYNAEAPTIPAFAALTITGFTVDISAETAAFTFAEGDIDNSYPIVTACVAPRQTPIAVIGPRRIFAYPLGGALDTEVDIWADLASAFGTLNTAQRVLIQVSLQTSEGLRGPYSATYADVVA